MHKLFNDFFERQFRAIILTVLKTICLRFKIRLWQLEEVFLETAVVIGVCSSSWSLVFFELLPFVEITAITLVVYQAFNRDRRFIRLGSVSLAAIICLLCYHLQPPWPIDNLWLHCPYIISCVYVLSR